MPRQRYIQDPVTFELIPADEYTSRRDSNAPFIMGDIQPYQSMQTGEMITSRSKHREHLRQHGLVEIGNEVNAAMTKQKPKENREDRRRTIAEILTARGF